MFRIRKFLPWFFHQVGGIFRLDCLRHEKGSHQPLVVGEGSLGVVGDGCYAGAGVFP